MSELATTPTAIPASSFWKRRIVDPIVHQMTQGITPERIALAIAVGSACALFPILGTTTVLCLIIGISLKLNQPIMQIINGILTPLHIPVIIGLFKVGAALFNDPPSTFHLGSMGRILWEHPTAFMAQYGVVALHAIAAWAILAPFWIAIVYLIFLPVVREIDSRRKESGVISENGEPPSHPIP